MRRRTVCITVWGMIGTSVLEIRNLRQFSYIQVEMLSWPLEIQEWGPGESLGVDVNFRIVSN